MRVTSGIWVSALLRRAQTAGAFATVVNKGAQEAGAIFICVNNMNGQMTLYCPAPQSFYETDSLTDREFECVLEAVTVKELDERLVREKSFDPDIWIVEIEDKDARSFIEIS